MLAQFCVVALVTCGIAMGQIALPPNSSQTKLGDSVPRPARTSATLAFDVVSIKPSGPAEPTGLIMGITPSGFVSNHQPLINVVMMAYFPMTRMFGSSKMPLTGEPDWLRKDLYTVDAKFDEPTAAVFKSATGMQRQAMLRPLLQAMLAERCKLLAHMTMADAPVYELVVKKQGPKLKETPPDEAPPEHALPIGDVSMMVPIYPKPAKEQLTFFRTSMGDLAMQLSAMVDRQVVDRTGLTGRYDFAVPRIRRDTSGPEGAAPDPGPMFTWDLSEAGLELRPAKAPQPMLVIDHIERPTEN